VFEISIQRVPGYVLSGSQLNLLNQPAGGETALGKYISQKTV